MDSAIRGDLFLLDALSIGRESVYRFTEYAKRLTGYAKGGSYAS